MSMLRDRYFLRLFHILGHERFTLSIGASLEKPAELLDSYSGASLLFLQNLPSSSARPACRLSHAMCFG